MAFNTGIESFLKIKGYSIARSESGKKVIEFEKDPIANDFWDYMSAHSSIRTVFNAFIKSRELESHNSLERLSKFLEEAETSFVFGAYCKNTNKPCQIILDRPNLLESNFKLPIKHRTTCPTCKFRNTFSKEDYKPIFKLEFRDIVKFFLKGCKKNVFRIAYSVSCYFCNKDAPFDEKIPTIKRCSKCKNISYLSTQFILNPEIENLIKDTHGYWLEWFVWKLTKGRLKSEIGLLIEKENKKIECDIVLWNGKLIVIECKDTTDESFISKLTSLNKFADYFVLVSTVKLRKDTLETARDILKQKFIYVKPSDIHNSVNIILGISKKS